MTDLSNVTSSAPDSVRCPECSCVFEQWNARMRAALHYIEAHAHLLRSKPHQGITREVLERVGKYELRLNQRVLLNFAANNSFFILMTREDSVSAHSLERLGMLARCSPEGTPMRERFWVITTLGRLVYEAYLRRDRTVVLRNRVTRKRLPASHRR